MLHSALPLYETFFRLGVATVLGVLVGLERERLDRAAGLRTHAVVAVASALLMLVSGYSFPDLTAGPRDPTRMAAQVVSGIGFLGAGVIIFRKNTVRGLTTAASVWAVAGIGLAAGGGMLAEAGIGTGFILVVQAGLRPLERRLFVRLQEHRLLLRVARGADRLAAVERAVVAAGVELRGLRLRPARGGVQDRVEIDLGAARVGVVPTLVETLRGMEGVRVVTYTSGAPRPVSASGADELDEFEAADDGPAEDDARGTGVRGR